MRHLIQHLMKSHQYASALFSIITVFNSVFNNCAAFLFEKGACRLFKVVFTQRPFECLPITSLLLISCYLWCVCKPRQSVILHSEVGSRIQRRRHWCEDYQHQHQLPLLIKMPGTHNNQLNK